VQLRAGVNALASPAASVSMALPPARSFLAVLASTDERYVKLQNKRIWRYTPAHSRRKYTGLQHG
jgi:hypothetical protein